MFIHLVAFFMDTKISFITSILIPNKEATQIRCK